MTNDDNGETDNKTVTATTYHHNSKPNTQFNNHIGIHERWAYLFTTANTEVRIKATLQIILDASLNTQPYSEARITATLRKTLIEAWKINIYIPALSALT